MTTYIHKDRGLCSSAFNIRRFKDQNGRWIESRSNNLPRGSVFKRLLDLEWSQQGEAFRGLLAQAKELLDESTGSQS